MNGITRRLMALALCVMLALTPPLAAAQDAQGWYAQVLITLSDGMQYFVPAQLVTTTLGDSVYWVDQSMLTEEQRAALAVGQLVLMNEAGEVVWQQPLDTSGMGAPQDMPVQVADPNAPENAFTVVLGNMIAMPMSPEEADAVLGGFGYMTPEPEITEPEITEPEITEPEITEPEITEPEITEPEITEPEITEPEITEPEITEPEISEPEISEPEITEPEITEPEITEPEITEPEITEPEITEPEITEPEITEPEITEPEITEPEITEPEITEPEEIEVEVPTYVTPNKDKTNLRSEPYKAEETLLIQVGIGDVLEVFEYYVDEAGAIWWSVYDYRTGNMGYMMADVVSALDEDTAYGMMAVIDEEMAVEEEPEVTEPEVTEPEVTEPEVTEPEVTEPEVTEPEVTEPEVSEPEATEPESSGYAVTNGKNGVNNLRSEPGAKDAVSYKNGELVLLGDSVVDGDNRLWYAVTMIRTGETGYMRDYLLKEISIDEATVLLDQIAQEQAKEEPEETEPEETEPEVTEPEATEPEVTEPEETEPEATEPEETEPEETEPEETEPEETEPEETEPEETEPEATEPEETEPEETEPEETEPEATEPEATEPEETEPEATEPEATEPEETEPEETEPEATEPEATEPEVTEPEATEPETNEPDQAAYALTLEQDNGAAIVLVEAPGANPPASGSVTLITQPTPLLVLDQQEDEEGNLWYLVQNMCAGDSGYIPAYKVIEITREQAEDAVYEIESIIPPYQPPVEETEEPEEEPDGEPTPTPTPEPTPTPIPDIPQELTEGEVGHYGRTNNKQVKFRKAPNSKEAWGNLKEGTPLYIISNDGVWCTARAEVNGKMCEGAIMAEFVTLMGVNEEIAYAATLENPETIVTPKPTETPTPVPTETPTPQPTETPTPQPEATEKPGPQAVEAYAIVTYDHADVRSNTDFNAALQTRLPVDTPVYVRQQMTDDEGNIWCDITYGDSQYGFMLNNKLRMMTDGEVAAYLESLNTPTPSPEPTPTPIPTETPIPTATPAPQELRMYARVLQNGTPLRGNPDNMAYLQNILDEGKVVYIFQSQVAADGMTWYLVQYSGQWGFVRADLVRLMGEEETNEYLASLEAEMATPTPMPLVTPEPVGPESTSAYAKLIKDAVNLRRTPSTSGTSLGRIAKNTLLLVTGEENDGTNTWYQVDYNGETGYVRSDMAQMLTIAQLQEYLAQQTQTTPAPNAGVSTTPNSSNNVSHVINGTPLKDLIPVDDSWTNNIMGGMPSYATATPDPNATPSPVPVENPASLISSFGTLTVNGVPAMTQSGTFEVYGKTAPYTAVKATVDVTVEAQSIGSVGLIASAIAESSTTRKYTVGETVSDANGDYRMTVKLPEAGEYIVEFTSGTSYARYGVTYDTSANATPAPTAAPLPTMEPVKEAGGFGLMPVLVGGLLIVIAAVVYGVYIYMRRKEEEEEEEAEDEEEELLRERMNQQRIRQAQQVAKPTAMPGANGAPRMPQSQVGQVPSYMKNAPTAPKAPVAPKAPAVPQAPVAPKAPTAPQASAQSPYARPVAPKAPEAPKAPVAPSQTEESGEAPRRRRRPPVDPNA